MSNAALALDPFETTTNTELAASARASQFVTFTVGVNAYGVDIMAVREIRSWTKTTNLPDANHAARGVLDIRGEIVEVFDLTSLLGTAAQSANDNQVVIVVAIGDRDVGLAVDAVSDIVDAEARDFADPPHKGGKVAAIVRQEEHLISILDLDVLLG